MNTSSTIELSELLGALSMALDMTEGQPAGHCMRTCWIGTNIGMELGLSDQDLQDLFYVLLLKDLGCTSNAARICQIFIHDDIDFKRDYLALDHRSLPKAFRFVLSHTGMGRDLSERFRLMLTAIRDKDSISKELVDTRCTRGADIARKMRFNDNVADGILNLDEHWDGKGQPHGLAGLSISLSSRIALMAQLVDVWSTSESPAAACDEVVRRSGKWFDPTLVAVFEHVAAREEFWNVWKSDNIESHLFALGPAKATATVDEDYLDDIALGFAEVIDSKSPFTSGHSERVTLITDIIAGKMGISDARRRWLRRAALLHDIGKLGVSNTILDKPGKLDEDEWVSIRKHPVYGQEILSRVNAFADLAPIAVQHHERLDGKGYPYGLSANQLPLETRIVTTADIFDALTANRPYRPAMPTQKALSIMTEMVGTQIDRDCLDALKTALGELDELWDENTLAKNFTKAENTLLAAS